MYIYMPEQGNEEMKKRVEELMDESGHEIIENELYQKEGMVTYWVDFPIIDVMNKTREYDELIVKRGKSIEVEGTCNNDEIRKLEILESKNVLLILNQESKASWLERVDNIDLNKKEVKYATGKYVTLILHVDETDSFLEENLIQYMLN